MRNITREEVGNDIGIEGFTEQRQSLLGLEQFGQLSSGLKANKYQSSLHIYNSVRFQGLSDFIVKSSKYLRVCGSHSIGSHIFVCVSWFNTIVCLKTIQKQATGYIQHMGITF